MESLLIQPINIFEDENVTENKELCSICLDEIIEENVDTIYTLETCNHKFHCKCILEMFISGYTDTCPLCRTLIQSTNNTYKDYDKFKLNLIIRYTKKQNANKLIVKLVERYEILNKKVSADRKHLSTLLKKRNSMTYFKDIRKHKTQVCKLKRCKTGINFKIFHRRRRSGFFNYVTFIQKYDFIKNSINNCKNEIKNYISETILDLDSKIKSIENLNNEDIKNLKEEIKRTQTRYFRNNKSLIKLKNNLLNIPINPIRC